MKLCKVKIIKNRTAAGTHFNYPTGYNSKVLSPFFYQNEGGPIEYCIATVPDDFKFTEDMAEVDKETAENYIDTAVDDDKDIKAAAIVGKMTAEEIVIIKEKKKEWCICKS